VCVQGALAHCPPTYQSQCSRSRAARARGAPLRRQVPPPQLQHTVMSARKSPQPERRFAGNLPVLARVSAFVVESATLRLPAVEYIKSIPRQEHGAIAARTFCWQPSGITRVSLPLIVLCLCADCLNRPGVFVAPLHFACFRCLCLSAGRLNLSTMKWRCCRM
jgi:hypothetical protein